MTDPLKNHCSTKTCLQACTCSRPSYCTDAMETDRTTSKQPFASSSQKLPAIRAQAVPTLTNLGKLCRDLPPISVTYSRMTCHPLICDPPPPPAAHLSSNLGKTHGIARSPPGSLLTAVHTNHILLSITTIAEPANTFATATQLQWHNGPQMLRLKVELQQHWRGHSSAT